MRDLAVKHGYTPHIRTRGEEIELKARTPGWRARRWVVEATHWLNRNRGILIRWSRGREPPRATPARQRPDRVQEGPPRDPQSPNRDRSLVVAVIGRDLLPGPASFTLARTCRGRPLTSTLTVAVPCCAAWASQAVDEASVSVERSPAEAAAPAPDDASDVVAPADSTSASCTPTAATGNAIMAGSHRRRRIRTRVGPFMATSGLECGLAILASSAKPQADLGPAGQSLLGSGLLSYHDELGLVLGGPGDLSQLAVRTTAATAWPERASFP